ncbi:MAG: fumarylacetoacetase, partial [Terriglobales bacterium]
MKPILDETHDPTVQSWVESANLAGADFPLQNLPLGVFRRRGPGGEASIGVAIGDRILDLRGMQSEGLVAAESIGLAASPCAAGSLHPLMALGTGPRRALRRRIHAILREAAPDGDRRVASRHLVGQAEVDMLLPAIVGDYTDFYASIFHATNVGKLFRPDNPLLPNYKYIPIGYHGRASSLIPSATEIRRPCGQTRDGNAPPKFAPTKSLD